MACNLMGHSKLRWRRPGKATLMAQVQPVPAMGMGRPMSVPTMRVEMGLPTKGPRGARGPAGRGGAFGAGQGAGAAGGPGVAAGSGG